MKSHQEAQARTTASVDALCEDLAEIESEARRVIERLNILDSDENGKELSYLAKLIRPEYARLAAPTTSARDALTKLLELVVTR